MALALTTKSKPTLHRKEWSSRGPLIRQAVPVGQLQPKLEVGPANDRFEQEADRVANQVMRMPAGGAVQKQCASCVSDSEEKVQRTCAKCEEEEKARRQPDAGGSSQASPSISQEAASGISSLRRGGGRPLPDSTRSFFEPRFGQDFSGVRIHTGEKAGGLARSIQARAFAVGNDIAFAPGQYQPQSPDGQRLLAHELTHTIQQTGSASLIRRDVAEKKPERPKGFLGWWLSTRVPKGLRPTRARIRRAEKLLELADSHQVGITSDERTMLKALTTVTFFSDQPIEIFGDPPEATSPDEVEELEEEASDNSHLKQAVSPCGEGQSAVADIDLEVVLVPVLSKADMGKFTASVGDQIPKAREIFKSQAGINLTFKVKGRSRESTPERLDQLAHTIDNSSDICKDGVFYGALDRATFNMKKLSPGRNTFIIYVVDKMANPGDSCAGRDFALIGLDKDDGRVLAHEIGHLALGGTNVLMHHQDAGEGSLMNGSSGRGDLIDQEQVSQMRAQFDLGMPQCVTTPPQAEDPS